MGREPSLEGTRTIQFEEGMRVDDDGKIRNHIVGVFRDREAAERVARAVRGAGVAPDRIRVGDPENQVTAIRGEMREEVDQTIVGPGPVGPFTKEATKGVALALPLATALGVLLLAPFAFIPIAGLPLWGRLLIMAGIGASIGFAVGLVLGGGLGAKGPAESLAAERGSVVSIDPESPSERDKVISVLREHQPIRVDETAEDMPAGMIATEEDRARPEGTRGIAHDVAGVVDHVVREPDDPQRPKDRSRRRAG